VWHTLVQCKGVLCCIFTNTRHLSYFRVCCAVYLLIPDISATSRSTMCRQSQSMLSCVDFTFLQYLYFGRPQDIVSVLPSLNLPFQLYVCTLETFLYLSVNFNWENVSIGVNLDGKQNWIADQCGAPLSDVAIFCLKQVAMEYFFRTYRF